MSDRKPAYGLLIDYEYCTGCHACEVACSQEYGWEAGMAGMKVIEVVEPLPKDKAYLAYFAFPTELCTLCARRTRQGLQTACEKQCMAAVIKYGRLEELAKEIDRPRMVLWAPRP